MSLPFALRISLSVVTDRQLYTETMAATAGVPMADTEYVKRMMGDTLAKGCAATTAANPLDPVEYLGQWLLQQADVKELQDQLQQQQESALKAEIAEQDATAASAEMEKQQQSKQQDALDKVSQVKSGLWELWQQAVAVCASETRVGGAYVAVVTEAAPALPEIPDVEEEAELAEEAPIAPPEPALVAEGTGEAAAEGDAAPEATPPAEDAAEGDEDEGGPPKPEYSKNILEYVVASSGQEWMLERGAALRRPPAPAEDAEEDSPAVPSAPTFRLLDQELPNMYLPNVAYTPTMVFFKQFPRVGAYWACALKGSGDRVEAIVAADSLMPPGNGRPLSEQDREFLGKLCAIVGNNMTELGSQRAAAAAEAAGKAALYKLERDLSGVESSIVVEPYTGEDLNQILKAAQAAVSKATGKLGPIQEAVKSVAAGGAGELLSLACAPPLTWNVLKALLLVMGRTADQVDTWLKCRPLITAGLFEEAASQQGLLPTGEAVWKEVRGRMAAATGARKALVDECPASCIGALLTMLLQQMRRTDRAVSEAAKAKKAVDDAEAAAAAAAAEAAKVEEEAKAAAAAQQAEEADAAAAAEAAAAADATGEPAADA